MAAAIRSAAHAVLAETVIEGALLRIAQAVIGLADRLEARLAVAAPRILVGVIFHRQLAIARFERRIVGGAFAFEQSVIVDVERHDAPNLASHTSSPPADRTVFFFPPRPGGPLESAAGTT